MDLFDVTLLEVPAGRRIALIKLLREHLDIGLARARDLTEELPRRLFRGRPEPEARALRAAFETLGVRVEVERTGARCYCVDPADPRRGDQGLSWIELDLAARRTSFIGPGSREVDEHPSQGAAAMAFEALVARQREAGAAIVDDEIAAHAALCERDAEIEAEILAAPDEVEPYQVYADWLTQQGDVRGELIALQLARETAAAGRIEQGIARSERELLSRHAGHLLGDIGWSDRVDEVVLRWRRGFVRAAEVSLASSSDPPTRLLRALFALPVCAMLDRFEAPQGRDLAAVYEALIAAPLAPTVRSVVLGDGIEGSDRWGCARLDAILGHLSRVEQLVVAARTLSLSPDAIEVGSEPLPRLRELSLRLAHLGEMDVVSLAGLPLPALHRLELRFGDGGEPRAPAPVRRYYLYYEDEDDANYLGAAELRPLLYAETLPSLGALELYELRCGDDLVEELARCPLLAQLETLVLRGVGITDEGARRLADRAASFAHLSVLRLEGNCIGKRGSRALRRSALEAVAVVGPQRER